ncbi:MAG: DUF4124 domain-containing protein [gamma proteobacterium symbiont of Phacoides pectinatus]
MRAAAMGGVGLLLLCGPLRGEIHRWVDEAGQTHFGDRPPQTVASEPMQLRINTIDTVEVAPPDAAGDGQGEITLNRKPTQKHKDTI